MDASSSAKQLYTGRARAYEWFVRAVAYRRGLRAHFRRSVGASADVRVLDAGCGSGFATLALRDALEERGTSNATFHGFDLTPAMLSRFDARLRAEAIEDVELSQANVLDLDALPDPWSGYDLVISASMMEYVPRDQLVDALSGLRDRLRPGGRLVWFVSRDNLLMRPLVGKWWRANLYTKPVVVERVRQAGFTQVSFARFPFPYLHLNLWGHIVEAR